MSVTPIYASLIAIVFLILSARVIGFRRAHRVSLGDGGDKGMQRRIRGQANCAEYAPIGLILLALAEMQGAGGLWLHLIGVMLLAGRIAHGYAFSRVEPFMAGRVGGMALTLISIGLAAVVNLGLALT